MSEEDMISYTEDECRKVIADWKRFEQFAVDRAQAYFHAKKDFYWDDIDSCTNIDTNSIEFTGLASWDDQKEITRYLPISCITASYEEFQEILRKAAENLVLEEQRRIQEREANEKETYLKLKAKFEGE